MSRTYDTILNEMISAISDDVDKRETSPVRTMLAPTAVQFRKMEIALETLEAETYAATAKSYDSLKKRGLERGMEPESASSAVFKGEFNTDILIGSRYTYDKYFFTATEEISTGVYKLESETTGSSVNGILGDILPVEHNPDLTRAKITELLIPGEDQEEKEIFRKKITTFDAQAFGGNHADYKKKTKEIDGVGGVKTYRVKASGSPVRLVIINSAYNIPSDTLIENVQNIIDPVGNEGEGLGLAPICHVVNIEGVQGTQVNIATTITYEKGWTWEDLKSEFNTMVDDYLLELNKTWEDQDTLIVRISQLESRALSLSGVLDISGTTLNGTATNLAIEADFIPVRGETAG